MTVWTGIEKVAWHFWGLWWFLWRDRYGMLVYKLWKRGRLPRRWLDETQAP